jgi:hypothetical protein
MQRWSALQRVERSAFPAAAGPRGLRCYSAAERLFSSAARLVNVRDAAQRSTSLRRYATRRGPSRTNGGPSPVLRQRCAVRAGTFNRSENSRSVRNRSSMRSNPKTGNGRTDLTRNACTRSGGMHQSPSPPFGLLMAQPALRGRVEDQYIVGTHGAQSASAATYAIFLQCPAL